MTKCSRTSCPATRNVVFKHRDTGARYCPKCAKAINAGNPGLVVREKDSDVALVCGSGIAVSRDPYDTAKAGRHCPKAHG